MVGQPEYPLAPAFYKAREWQAEQERQLTDAQRRSYDDIRNRQTLERRQQQERLDAVRAQLQEQAKNRKLKAELVHNPPVLIADPYVHRQARFIIAGEKRLERLDRRHAEERIKTLKEFAQEREHGRVKAEKNFTGEWKKALLKTAEHERAREPDRDKADDFEKGR